MENVSQNRYILYLCIKNYYMRQKYAYLIIVLLLGTAILSIWSAPDDVASAQQLYSRCVSLLFKERHADLVHTATALVSKSQQEHNRKLEGYGWFYHGAGCLYGGKAKDGNKSLHKALNIANELKDDSLQAITLNTIGVYEVMTKRNNFIGQHYFLKAIEHAKRPSKSV